MKPTERYRIAASQDQIERLIAELYSLDTLGIEETDSGLLAYFAAGSPASPVLGLAAQFSGVVVVGPESVPVEDWARSWREGLEARRIGRLWIRPSFRESRGVPELVIDPEQAFGSGEHASTRLSLRLLLAALEPADRVLDVGSGSGILVLGAECIGARPGIGVDVDLTSCHCARANARRNGLLSRFYCGRVDALAPAVHFEIALANMLLPRLVGVIEALRARAARTVIVAGYIEAEREDLLARMRHDDWRLRSELTEAQSGDTWCASRWDHIRPRQSSSSASSVDSNE